MGINVRLFNADVTETLLYGTVTWAPLQFHYGKLPTSPAADVATHACVAQQKENEPHDCLRRGYQEKMYVATVSSFVRAGTGAKVDVIDKLRQVIVGGVDVTLRGIRNGVIRVIDHGVGLV